MSDFGSLSTVEEIVSWAREQRAIALAMAESCRKAYPEFILGWQSRAQAALELLRDIKGTDEAMEIAREEAARDV